MPVPPISVKNVGGSEFPERRIVVKLTKTPKPRMTNSGGVAVSFLDTPDLFINKDSNLVDVKVSLARNYGGADPQAQVSILNLTEEHINMFTTYQFTPDYPDIVTVYAGYETIGAKTSEIPFLFQGNIIWALPTTGRPDVWFNITCVESFFDINTVVSYTSPKNVPMNPIMIANDIVNQAFGNRGKNKFFVNYRKIQELAKYNANRAKMYYPIIKNYSYNGTLGNFIDNEVYQWNKMVGTYMNGEVFLSPNSDDMNYLNTVAPPLYTISASSATPMIGIPKPNPTGVDLTTLFNREYLPDVNFKLDSAFFQSFSTRYWIQRVVYDLHLRGKNFYTHITARR